MNINYNDQNMMVKYLQEFLYENYSSTVKITGKYTDNTHESLIAYLSLPTVSTMQEVYTKIAEEFPDIPIHWTLYRGLNLLKIMSKPFIVNAYHLYEYLEYLGSIEKKFREVIYELGWKVDKYPEYDYSNIQQIVDAMIGNVDKLEIIVSAESRRNVFPNRDLLFMVNQFNSSFYSNLSIYIDKNASNVITAYSNRINYYPNAYKLAIVPCLPNHTYTIAHGYGTSEGKVEIPMYIGSAAYTTEEIITVQDVGVPIENIYGYEVSDNYVVYQTSSNAKNIVIQIPDNNITDTSNINKLLIIDGDIGDNKYNIPLSEFADNPWAVNDKFTNYLLEMSITPYSSRDNIAYLQDMIYTLTGYKSNTVGLYDDDLREAVIRYQLDRSVLFSTGYMDVSTELAMLLELDRKGYSV